MLNPLHALRGRLSSFRRCPGSSWCVAGLPDVFRRTISVQYTLGLFSSLVTSHLHHCPTISFVIFRAIYWKGEMLRWKFWFLPEVL